MQPTSDAHTPTVDGVWYSLTPAMLPPDDRAGWLDLQRHSADGTILLERFLDPAEARAWLATRLGVAETAWQCGAVPPTWATGSG